MIKLYLYAFVVTGGGQKVWLCWREPYVEDASVVTCIIMAHVGFLNFGCSAVLALVCGRWTCHRDPWVEAGSLEDSPSS